MRMPPYYAAGQLPIIFDLDGTITRNDTYLPFLVACMASSRRNAYNFPLLPCYVAQFYLGRINNHTLKEKFLSAVLRRSPIESLAPVVDSYVARLFRKGLNSAVFQLLEGFLSEGRFVIIATASIDLYVNQIAARLGVENLVCSQVEVQNGQLTGRLQGPNCHGIEKLERLKNAFGDDLVRQSIAFTDHHADLPLIQRARQSVLVNPSRKTRQRLFKIGYRLKPWDHSNVFYDVTKSSVFPHPA